MLFECFSHVLLRLPAGSPSNGSVINATKLPVDKFQLACRDVAIVADVMELFDFPCGQRCISQHNVLAKGMQMYW